MNSVISQSMICRNSEVTGGGLNSCEIKDSTLGDISDHNSSISTCQIDNTKLHFSKLYSCEISQDTQQISCKPLSTFRRFPPEIRTMIFSHAIKPTSELPPLITAFRGDQLLYHEALEYIHKTQGFTINNIRRLNDTQLRYVRRRRDLGKSLGDVSRKLRSGTRLLEYGAWIEGMYFPGEWMDYVLRNVR
jgi:hypothetical protein